MERHYEVFRAGLEAFLADDAEVHFRPSLVLQEPCESYEVLRRVSRTASPLGLERSTMCLGGRPNDWTRIKLIHSGGEKSHEIL